MKSVTLSVGMPNFNHAQFLPESIQAIIDQSYQPQEIIIIDDASTDNSIEVIEKYCLKYPQIKLVRNERNLGAVANGNRLLEMCTGDYIYWASADDKVLPGFFEKSMRMLEEFPTAGLCGGLYLKIDEYGKYQGISKMPIISSKACFVSPQQAKIAFAKFGSFVQCLAAICRRQAVIDAGGLISELGAFVDGFLVQVLTLRYGACFIPEPMTAWRQMETSYSLGTGGNLQKVLKIKQHADMLMQSTYKQLFPPDCVEGVRRQLAHWGGLCAWDAVGRQQEKFLQDVVEKFRPSSSWADRFFLAIMRLLIAWQKLSVKLFFVGNRIRSPLAWFQFWKNYLIVWLRFHGKRWGKD